VNTPGARLVSVLLLGVLALSWLALPVQGSVPPQQGTPHPTLPPTAGPPAGAGGPGVKTKGGGAVSDRCAGLHGTVVNWGFHNEPGVTVRLGDGGWEVVQITSTDGRYGFGSLGEGMAFLKTDLTAGQAKTLHLMVGDVAIRLRCDLDIIANLGLYSSPQRPALPATLTMRVAPSALLPGKTATFYLTLKNGMPNPISHVFVTDYLPDGLKVINVVATRGSVEVLNGQMVTVAVGGVPQGGEETVQIVAQADPALANGTRLKNTASLLYAESVADQAAVTLVVGGGQAGAPSLSLTQAPTPTATPSPSPAQTPTPGAAGATPTAAPSSPSPTWTPVSPPTATPNPSPTRAPTLAANKTATATPSGSLLPTTGQGAPPVWPAAIFVVVLLALGAYNLRRRPSTE
jgi:uncharacterized repeat protein (TIGR01451 family)